MQITKLHAALLAVLITLTGCSKNTGIGGAAGDASETTLKANALFAQELKLDDQQRELLRQFADLRDESRPEVAAAKHKGGVLNWLKEAFS